MNIKVTGKDLEVTDAIKAYVEKKVERLVKYFDDEFDVVATVKSEKTEKVAEIRVSVKGDLYKAVTAHKDLYAAIDKDIDILEGQIRKFKTKKEKMLIKKRRTNASSPLFSKIFNGLTFKTFFLFV